MSVPGGFFGGITPVDMVLEQQRTSNSYLWATITDVAPLTIQLDGEGTPLEMTPEALVPPERLQRGGRVWVQIYGRRVVVLGVSGGGAALSPNLTPDPSLEDATPGDLPDAVPSLFANYSTQWSRTLTGVGSGGAVASVIDGAFSRTGAQSLRLSTSTAGSPSNFVGAASPHFDVEPGATYVCGFYVGKAGSGVTRVYWRTSAGSDDALSEYLGNSLGSSVPMYPAFENWDVPYLGSTLDPSLMSRWTSVVVVPAGITRMAFSVLSYQPVSGTTVYFDDFTVTKVDNATTSDTGWLPITLLNGWVNYGAPYGYPQYRKVGATVYVRGLIKNGSLTGTIANLPAGFRPQSDTIMPAQIASPGPNAARIDMLANGDIVGRTGMVANWTSMTLAPFIADN